jgi:hypothetical protein
MLAVRRSDSDAFGPLERDICPPALTSRPPSRKRNADRVDAFTRNAVFFASYLPESTRHNILAT